MNRHIYTLKKPASWNKEWWKDSLLLGNGLTGALIPGGIGEEEIQFNRHDLWQGGPDREIPDISDTFREMRAMMDAGDYYGANQNNLLSALREKQYRVSVETPYPLGYLKVMFAPGGPFKHYRRGINMRTGEAFVEFTVNGCRYHREMFISRADDIAVLRMRADKPFTTVYDFRMFKENDVCETTEAGMKRTAKNGEAAVEIRFLGEFTSAVKGSALSVTGQEYTVLIRCGSHGTETDLSAFVGETYETLLEKHTALHTPLYDSVSIELADDAEMQRTNEDLLDAAYEDTVPPALLERLWRYGRYLFISGASERGNPIPLHGLWHGTERLPWSQYTANENVQMTYWHAMAGGLSYALPALLRHYTSKMETFRECARKVFGMRGIWVSAYTSPNVGGVCVPVSVISNWISGAGWLSRHFWEYYQYTGDEKLLREEILPFMYEAALFYLDYVVETEDGLRVYPSVSPENSPRNLKNPAVNAVEGHPCSVVENATMDFAVMKELLTNLLSGMEVTGMYGEHADEFRRLLSKIPAYSVNEDGAVKEWMHPDLEDNYNHRHMVHLYPVFPGNEVTQGSDPALFAAFRRAVELRNMGSMVNWSFPHMACIYSRFGEAEKAMECMDIMAKSTVVSTLTSLAFDWRRMGMTVEWPAEAAKALVQLDSAFGTVNAVQEMLFCAYDHALSVLPALPARLASGTVRGICFPGGKADIRWDDSGRVDVTVYATRDVDLALLVCTKERGRIVLPAGASGTYSFTR